MIVKDKKTRILYRVEPINEPPPLDKYWRGYRQKKLADGSLRDEVYNNNPILLKKTDCVPVKV